MQNFLFISGLERAPTATSKAVMVTASTLCWDPMLTVSGAVPIPSSL